MSESWDIRLPRGNGDTSHLELVVTRGIGVDEGQYVITHEQSGYSVSSTGRSFPTVDEAVAAAARVAALADWTQPGEFFLSRQPLGAAVREALYGQEVAS